MSSNNIDFSMPSTTNISNFVSTKLWFKYPDQNNYQAWKEQMTCMLYSHGLLGFVVDEGCSVVPMNGDKPVQMMSRDSMIMWRRRSDELVRGWILSACSDDVICGVATLKTAKDVWLELERMSKYQISISPSASLINEELSLAKCSSLVQQDATGCKWEEYLPLQQAVAKGDWEETMQIFCSDGEAMKAGLDVFKSTVLHVAVGTGQKGEFLKKLVDVMPDEIIAQQTVNGDTALSMAAANGNKEAVTILVARMRTLLYIPNNRNDFPVQTAAKYAQKKVLDYLISVTDICGCNGQTPYDGSAGLRLIVYVIDADFFDTACDLVEKYPWLATQKLRNKDSALKKIAEKNRAFSTRNLVVSKLDRLILFVSLFSPDWVWKRVNESLSAKVSRINDKQQSQNKAKDLVRKLCNKLKHIGTPEGALEICCDAILMTTQSGATYVAEVIEQTFSGSIYSSMDAYVSIVHVAIQNRSLGVLKLIYGKSCHRHLYSDWADFEGNNLLHLAAKLTPAIEIKCHPVVAHQMQDELKWFEEVKRLIPPACGTQLNKAGKTPWMVFRDEHMSMKLRGEKWLKEAASSYTIVSALIATVTFAAAITVPGGTNDSSEGLPVLLKRPGFFIFAMADILSLCLSVTSLLIFLAMSTTQHTYEAFLTFHPHLIRVGIGSLFVSVVSMMISFAAACFLVFTKHSIWIPIMATCYSTYPVLVFFVSYGQLLPFMKYSGFRVPSTLHP